ncbi:hypothetical protein ABID81_002958 [Frigoribacterium sp. PvP054]|uniref:hypothetical protein n=1 Tax=Frigoribacterium sp. PvP054 TaxID=3156438 RepID=UPI00339A5E3C
MDKFKLIAFAIVGGFAMLMVGGFLVLEATQRPTSTYVIFATSILGNLAVFGGLGYKQAKQSETLDVVAKNVNGNNTRMLDTIDKQAEQINDLLTLLPGELTQSVDVTPAIDEKTMTRLRAEADKLPKHSA